MMHQIVNVCIFNLKEFLQNLKEKLIIGEEKRMKIMNPVVFHKTFGSGKITKIEGSLLEVTFKDGVKQFQFPNAFDSYLKSEDKDLNAYLSVELVKMKQLREEEENRRKEKLFLEEQIRKQRIITENIGNVVFKYNFCDGGKSNEQIGFHGACSDDLIDYNIEKRKYVWCSAEDSPCNQYYHCEITRDELDEYCEDDGYICYESQLLRSWKAPTGYFHNGDRSGKPITLKNAKTNKLCVLTTREPKSSESERLIFGVFLIDETCAGDNINEGYASNDSEFKLKLSPSEARSILYWNYHANDNQPSKPGWGTGLFRYICDLESAQILRDIAAIKKGKKDGELAEKLFKHYCQQNNLSADDIPEIYGALQR